MKCLWDRLHCLLAVLFFLAGLVAGSGTARADISADWTVFRNDFILADGRVVDDAVLGTSHSRSQGVALLAAVAADDRESFSRILGWTEANLDIRGDGLYALEWRPEAGVVDPEDAADGDILIAWALARADDRWHTPEFHEQAIRSIEAIRSRLLRRRGPLMLLLPSSRDEGGARTTTINLSYWIFPAFRRLAELDPVPAWGELLDSGLSLVSEARFGLAHLPTEWIDVDDRGTVTPAAGQPPHFGTDAARIPLYLTWGLPHDPRLPELLAPFINRWKNDSGAIAPAWIDVATGAISPARAGAGLDAILAVTRAAASRTAPVFPSVTPRLDFTAANLILLGEISASDPL